MEAGPVQWENLDVSDVSTAATDVPSLPSGINPALTGRPALSLYLTCDDDTFSQYQVVIRKCIELFEAHEADVHSNAQGRNRPVVLGQVGIRCRFCAAVPPKERCKGAMYYPSRLVGLYQAAQNLANSHLVGMCPFVPADIRDQLVSLKDKKSAAGGGKTEWADRAHNVGVFEDDHGLRFAERLDSFRTQLRGVGHH
jgi:hypothetical protein